MLREQVADQVGVLSEIAAAAGTSVRYLKPHGALYHRVLDDEEQARAVLDGSGRLPVLGMPGALLTLAAAAGRTVFHEGFPDRGYTAGGPAGAAVGARCAGRGRRTRSWPRRWRWPRTVDSVCLHGDSPGAVEHAVAVRRVARGGRFRRSCLRYAVGLRPLHRSGPDPVESALLLWMTGPNLWTDLWVVCRTPCGV